jgi:hypothetical protein
MTKKLFYALRHDSSDIVELGRDLVHISLGASIVIKFLGFLDEAI